MGPIYSSCRGCRTAKEDFTHIPDADRCQEVPENQDENQRTHVKARTGKYGTSDVDRAPVDENKIEWSIDFPEYKPVEYTLEKIIKDRPEWADVDETDDNYDQLTFNQIDGKVNRKSHMGSYEVMKHEGYLKPRPINPIGRTGISGRGILGKWGPNHAADPVVTRWKRSEKGEKVFCDGDGSEKKPLLEFVTIQRRDTHEWAIPGGMVDAGEQVSLTLKREFGEEAMNSLDASEKESTKKHVDELFKAGEEIYRGYVDDPRNTDNAWMETVAVNFHDDDGTTVGKIPLQAGDDAKNVKWMAIDRELKLYSNHMDFIREACMRRGAYFPN